MGSQGSFLKTSVSNEPWSSATAQILFERLHPLMAWLAAIFVLVLVGDTIVGAESPYATIFTVAGWAIWAVFVTDFGLRLVLSSHKGEFLRQNWWQLLFLVLPFLALMRFLMAVRLVRAGRVLSAAVRGARSAASKLRSRLATVAAVTMMVILLGANVLFEFAGVKPYSRALHDAALATISGAPTSGTSGVSQILNVMFALYSVVVFATVAGSVGAFFFERRAEEGRDVISGSGESG